MKKLCILLWAIIPLNLLAQQPKGEPDIKVQTGSDTLEVYFGVGEVIVVKGNDSSGSLEHITINIPRKKTKIRNATVWSGLYYGVESMMFGGGDFLPPEEYDFMRLNLMSSRNLQINFWEERVNLASNRLNMITGLGYERQRYQWNGDYIYVNADRYPDLDSPLPYFGFEETRSNFLRGRLIINNLTVPVLLNFCANPGMPENKQFNLTAGVVGKYRYRVRSRGYYKRNVFRSTTTYKEDFGVIPLGLDANLRMRIGNINCSVQYGLLPLFFKDLGPDLRTLSVTLALLHF